MASKKGTPPDTGSIDVLVVDDSPVVREVMYRILSRVRGLRPSVAFDAVRALERIEKRKPDVILLDLMLPRMDGFEFLQQIMSTDPVPVVVLSGTAPEGSDRALRALDLGAVELLAKPTMDLVGSLTESSADLVATIRAAASVKVRKRGLGTAFEDREAFVQAEPVPQDPGLDVSPRMSDLVVAIGASTGGPEALGVILGALSANSPGIVIAQHMPGAFTSAFARGLDSRCALRVSEARDGDPVMDGHALVSPGDQHITVRGRPGKFRVCLKPDSPGARHQPSVDVLFRSVAKSAGSASVGVVLTGMGSDGADGLAAMKREGAQTIAESRKSAAVYGMPRQAIERGVVDRVASRVQIADAIIEAAQSTAKRIPANK